MCGIAGFTNKCTRHSPEIIIKKMTDIIQHRGPDADGIYVDNQISLGHRRLSIIDLSESANQPLFSSDKNQAIVFNGEIYNFPELKSLLLKKGYKFNTKTDTEVLLYSYQEYGEDCLAKLRGMYAFAIWDFQKRKFFIATDRIGKKPVYYYHNQDKFAFASELKSLLEIPDIPKVIDYTAVADFLRYQYIPYPKTIYKNIFKLEPGNFLTYRDRKIKKQPYWDISFNNYFQLSEDDIAENLINIIDESVNHRLISDVPLGAFLSGGIDSSAVVAIMSEKKKEPVKTCTIGFTNGDKDERKYARDLADQYSTNHHEFMVDKDEMSILPKLAWHFDEPFADSSLIPTYYVSKMARKIVTVALSGDGGDENFVGYNKYFADSTENILRQFIPDVLSGLISRLTRNVSIGYLRRIHSFSSSISQSPARAFFSTNSFISDNDYQNMLSEKLKNDLNDYDPFLLTETYYNKADTDDHLSKIQYVDLKTYLPGDILVKVDRMSMANSLEVRAPFLDHNIIEFAAKIPPNIKFKGRNKKYILKKSLTKILDSNTLNRPKSGFELPLNDLLRFKLNSFVEFQLFQKTYMHEFFNMSYIKEYWDNLQKNNNYSGMMIWELLMFSLWYDISVNNKSVEEYNNLKY